MPDYIYEYYEDPQNTKLVARVAASDLDLADSRLRQHFHRNPLDLYLFIRQPTR